MFIPWLLIGLPLWCVGQTLFCAGNALSYARHLVDAPANIVVWVFAAIALGFKIRILRILMLLVRLIRLYLCLLRRCSKM